MGFWSNTTSKRKARIMAGVALAALLLGVLGRSRVVVPVTVDGTSVTAQPGESVADVVMSCGAVRPACVLAASDNRVVGSRESSGSVVVYVNDRLVPAATPVRWGDRIETHALADTVEEVIVETRTVEIPARTIGRGTVEKQLIPGVAGTERVTYGAVTGDVLGVETIVDARQGLSRMVPAEGTPLIALTFDDGPWPGQTEAVLAVLQERSVPATFFMLGREVERRPELARAVAEAGHAVGNHTYGHVSLGAVGPGTAQWEIEITNQIIESATGARPVWLRAPGGSLGGHAQEYIAGTGMRSVLWTVDPQDWRAELTPDQLAQRVIGAAHPGAIVVLHDGGGDQAATIAALPAIIDGLRAAGYEFVTVDELPNPRAGW